MADWKKHHYYVTPNDWYSNERIIVLTDVGFWAENYENLIEWCSYNGCTVEGMTVKLSDEKALTAFCLRW